MGHWDSKKAEQRIKLELGSDMMTALRPLGNCRKIYDFDAMSRATEPRHMAPSPPICNQIPLVLRIVLVSQEKCIGIQQERSLKIKPGAFTPPRGRGVGDDDSSSGGGGDPFAFAAVGGLQLQGYANMMCDTACGVEMRCVAVEDVVVED